MYISGRGQSDMTAIKRPPALQPARGLFYEAMRRVPMIADARTKRHELRRVPWRLPEPIPPLRKCGLDREPDLCCVSPRINLVSLRNDRSPPELRLPGPLGGWPKWPSRGSRSVLSLLLWRLPHELPAIPRWLSSRRHSLRRKEPKFGELGT